MCYRGVSRDAICNLLGHLASPPHSGAWRLFVLVLPRAKRKMVWIWTIIALSTFPLARSFWRSMLPHEQALMEKPLSPGSCLVLRCPKLLVGCVQDAECRQCTDCMRTCGTDDVLCTTNCFFKYSTEKFNRLTQCGVDHQCFPSMTWSNMTCPSAHRIEPRIDAYPVANLSQIGDMVVVRGSHPIYDCLPCQRLQFKLQPDGGVATKWSTAIDGVVRGAEYVLYQETKNRFKTKYKYVVCGAVRCPLVSYLCSLLSALCSLSLSISPSLILYLSLQPTPGVNDTLQALWHARGGALLHCRRDRKLCHVLLL